MPSGNFFLPCHPQPFRNRQEVFECIKNTNPRMGTEFARIRKSSFATFDRDRCTLRSDSSEFDPGIRGKVMNIQSRPASVALLCALLCALLFTPLCILPASFVAAATADGGLNRLDRQGTPANFTILDPDNHQVIGHGEYRSETSNGRMAVWGENDYHNGEHDIEHADLALNRDGSLPVLEKFEHTFFNADGSKKLMASADRQSSDAACMSYEAGEKNGRSEKLEFPPDTYVGAAAVIAMEMAFRQGREQISFHTFDCAPGPTLADVTAQRSQSSEHWTQSSKPLVQVQMRAKLGWVGSFFGGLLPHRSAWFDPAHGWQYVGGKIQRYLARGPQVILVREGSEQGKVTSDAR
jgi:hypothetical protein